MNYQVKKNKDFTPPETVLGDEDREPNVDHNAKEGDHHQAPNHQNELSATQEADDVATCR